MPPWIAAVVADLTTNRNVNDRTLIDWQHQIAARIRWKIQAIRDAERTRAHQIALFDEGQNQLGQKAVLSGLTIRSTRTCRRKRSAPSDSSGTCSAPTAPRLLMAI